MIVCSEVFSQSVVAHREPKEEEAESAHDPGSPELPGSGTNPALLS